MALGVCHSMSATQHKPRPALQIAAALGLLLAACGGSSAPPSQAAASASSPVSAAAKPAPSVASAAAKPAASSPAANPSAAAASGSQSMDQLVAAAKKEGQLIVGTAPDPSFRDKILPVFQKEYGIQAQELSATSSTALATKLVQESAAGVHSADVTLESGPGAANILLPAKLYAPLKPALIIPDVNDPSKWAGGKVWFQDPEQMYVVRMVRQIRYTFTVNPGKIDASKLKSANDFLDTSLKGKIGAYDPTIAGTGQSAADGILNALGVDYFKKLYLGQDIKFGQDDRTMGDWVARGTYPVAIGVADDERARQIAAGFKIAPVPILTPGMAGAQCGSFLLGLQNQAPHPAAAKLFANWLLTKQGMQTFQDGEGQAVIRLDADTSKLDPADIPGPDYLKLNDECAWSWLTGERVKLNGQVKALVSGN